MGTLPKLLLLSILCILLSGNANSQDNTVHTYVIEFKDKGYRNTKALNPIEYLSQKAVDRRIKYNIPFTSEDIPINKEYIDAVLAEGVKLKAYSRWFNLVVVEANPEKIALLGEKSFVKNTIMIDNETSISRKSSPSSDSKFGTTSPWTPSNSTKKAKSDVYDYGAAYAQINQLKGIQLHNAGFDGKGMTIAVLDAGFNSVDAMACFDSLRINNQIKGTRNVVEPAGNLYSSSISTHGTNVLSLMAANRPGEFVGTAPKADYFLIRTEDAPTEYIMEEFFWVMGAEYADSVGADLINSSLGYTVFDNAATSHTYMDMDGNTTMVTKGADKAAEKGILVVNSAGNEGSSFWKYIGAPADGDSVFSIGSVDISGNRSGFSSVGPTYDRRIKPDVCANGQSTAVYSPFGIQYGSGTSYSSPITCGMTACFWQANPTLNNMQIIEALKITSSKSKDADTLMGWGIPDFALAINTLSVEKKLSIEAIKCYPNPFIESINIVFSNPLPPGEVTIEIYSMNSLLVRKTEIYSNGLKTLSIPELSNLPSGIYLLKASIGKNVYNARISKL